MIERPLRISSPRKVTSPFHTFSSGQVHILARELEFTLTGIDPIILSQYYPGQEFSDIIDTRTSPEIEMDSDLPQ